MPAAAMPLEELERWLQARANKHPTATSLPTVDSYVTAIGVRSGLASSIDARPRLPLEYRRVGRAACVRFASGPTRARARRLGRGEGPPAARRPTTPPAPVPRGESA